MATRKRKAPAALETFMRTLLSEFKATLKASAALPMLLTQPEAAAQLSIGMTKLNQLIKAGRLKTITLGVGKRGKPSHPMVPRSELERLTTPASTPPTPTRRKRTASPPTTATPATRESVELMLKRKR